MNAISCFWPRLMLLPLLVTFVSKPSEKRESRPERLDSSKTAASCPVRAIRVIFVSVHDVLADRPGEEEGLLGNHADLARALGWRNRPDVAAVEENRSLGGIV